MATDSRAIDTFHLPIGLRRRILDHAKREHPRECCGLLVGRGRQCLAVMPARNVARRRRTRYEVDPRAHIALRRVLREGRPSFEIIGAYHSHPATAPVLSETDLAQVADARWVYLVVGRVGSRWQIRAFAVTDGQAIRLALAGPAGSPRVRYHRRSRRF